MSIPVAKLADTARSLTTDLRSQAANIDAGRRIPLPIVDTLRSAGFFRMQTPAELGGLELPPTEAAEIIEALAYANGSVGWCAMIGSGTNALASRLPEVGACEVLTSSGIITGGTFHPRGTAVARGDGYVLRGRWPFGSG
jgi:alkylation response protein AidB-like acyl-CoA dehydrogenase